jgi:hypothetical protein
VNYTEIEVLRGIVKDELNVSSRTGIVEKIVDGYVHVRIGHSTVLRNLKVIGDISYLTAGTSVVVLSLAGTNYCLSTGVFSGSTSLPAGALSYSLGSQYYDKTEIADLLERKSDSGHSHRYDHLEAVSGTIGGFEILDDTIRSSVGNFALTSNANATRMVMGTTTDVVVIDGKHATYRLWAGDDDPATAPFSVEKDGKIHASAGDIAGWDILSDRLSKNNVELKPSGEIIVGTGDDIAAMGTTQSDWRLWIGDADPAFAPFRVDKDGNAWLESATIDLVLESDNYEAGVRGWKLDSSGWAEFGDVTVRGRIEASVFAKTTISGVSGQMVISIGDNLIADVYATSTSIDVATDALSVDDIIQFKPDSSRNEWMRIETGPAVITGGYRYGVERDLASGGGPYAFESGTACMRKGTATDLREPQPLAAGVAEGAFGALQPGGSGSTSAGGWIVLDGEASSFSVVTRQGPVWSQYQTTVRIGNLVGVLDYITETWGLFIGDDNDYMAYDEDNGLRIQFIGSGYDTKVSSAGLQSELLKLGLLSSTPTYEDGYARIWLEHLTGEDPQLRVRIKDGAEEFARTIGDMLRETYDSDLDNIVESADNAHTVDSIHANTSATANQLLALNGSAKLPADITGDADTVDGLHSTDFFRHFGSAQTETIDSGGSITVDVTKRSFIVYAAGTGTEDVLSGIEEDSGTFADGDVILIRAVSTDVIKVENDNAATGHSGIITMDGENTWIHGNKYLLLMYRSGTDDFIVIGTGSGATRHLQVRLVPAGTSLATGDKVGDWFFHVPPAMDGMMLVYIHVEVDTAGSQTGTTADFQLYNIDQTADILTTKVTIDTGETGSDTAATAYSINTANAQISENDKIRLDCDALQSTAPKGLTLTLGYA